MFQSTKEEFKPNQQANRHNVGTLFQSTKEEFKHAKRYSLSLALGRFNPPKRNLNEFTNIKYNQYNTVSIHQRGI